MAAGGTPGNDGKTYYADGTIKDTKTGRIINQGTNTGGGGVNWDNFFTTNANAHSHYNALQEALGRKPTSQDLSDYTTAYKRYLSNQTNPNDNRVWNQYGEVIGISADGKGYTDFSAQASNATVDPTRIWQRGNLDAQGNTIPGTQRVLTSTPLRGTSYADYSTGYFGEAPKELQKTSKNFMDHNKIREFARAWLASNPNSLWDEDSLSELWMKEYEDISTIPDYMKQYANEFQYSGAEPRIDPVINLVQSLSDPNTYEAGGSILSTDPMLLGAAGDSILYTDPMLLGGASGQTLRDWAAQNGLGNVGYDPQSRNVLIGQSMFTAGNIPGTYLDPATGQHIVIDPAALQSALGMGQPQNDYSLEDLLGSVGGMDMSMFAAPSWQDIYEEVLRLIPEADIPAVLGWDEAIMRAESQLDPLYDQSLNKVLKDLAVDQIGRGFFGQLPASVITAEAAANIENLRNAEIAQLAQSIVDASYEDAYRQEQLALDRSNQMLNAILESMNMYNQSQQSIRSDLLTLAGLKQNASQFEQSLALERANSMLSNAIARTELAGMVTNETDARILGVPVGTESWAAKNAAMERAQELQLAQMRALSSGSGKSSNDDEPSNEVLYQIQAEYGVNKQTALAIWAVSQAPNRASAIADYDSSKEAMEESGVNTTIVRQIIDLRYPEPEGPYFRPATPLDKFAMPVEEWLKLQKENK